MTAALWSLVAVGAVLVAMTLRSPSLRPVGGSGLVLGALVWSGMVAAALPPSAARWAVLVLGTVPLTGVAWLRLQRGDRSAWARPAAGAAPVLACVLVGWTFLVDILSNESAAQRVTAAGASLLLLLAVVVLARSGGMPREELPASVGVVGLVGVLASSAVTGSGWTTCHEDKCSVVGALLAGPYASENVLGLFALFTLAAAISGWRGRHLAVGTAFCGAVIVLTGSRTSLYAAGALVGLHLVSAVLDRLGARAAGAATGVVRSVLLAVPLAVAGLGTLLIVSSDSQLLSGRGRIWLMASVVLDGRWVAGVGLSRWEELQGIGLLPSHFAHSQILVLLFSGGGVALALHTGLMTSLLRSGTRDGLRGAAVPLALLVSGLTEAVWNPLTVDALTWATVVALVCAGGATAGSPGVLQPGPEVPAEVPRAPRARAR